MRTKPIKITLNGEVVYTPRVLSDKDKRDAELLDFFDTLKKENPDAAPFTLCRVIASMRPISLQTTYSIIRKYGRI